MAKDLQKRREEYAKLPMRGKCNRHFETAERLVDALEKEVERNLNTINWLAEKCELFDKDFGFEYSLHESPREKPFTAGEWIEQAEQATGSEGK